MYKSIRQDFDNDVGILIDRVFWLMMRCKRISVLVKWMIHGAFKHQQLDHKHFRKTFRCGRTKKTNNANRIIESLDLYLDKLKKHMENTPEISDHLHVLFVIKLVDETIKELKKDFVDLDRAAILVGFDV